MGPLADPGALPPTQEMAAQVLAARYRLGEYRFTFTDKDCSASEHYEATMTEPDGTEWKCVYDYGYGAGLTDEDD
jgi:hypothetical protein